ncbi:hypothetical protein [Chryseobacterium vrystaatense]|uniref:Uncharacterized protein n=1 Tax=Chryseobacterium vrystaatense TaxID=307480 RepID=A0ABR4UP04_9FLAO|nr:hypothetical protein [Chryseobacterium vrystaatense]KFF26848.1 hypothetical protein IW16_06090 [Chryseobacterium vrystaatense]
MTIIDHKDIKLSAKVQQILFSRGYSHIFNWEDYSFYKEQTKNAIFRADSIANLFIKDTCEFSDYAEYEY